MAEVTTGETVNKDNPNFEILDTAGNTPSNPGSGLIIWDGTNLKINVAADNEAPSWKTITQS